ncbi:MAG: methylenetetrahydrofolate reductase [Candidatus Wallbacteria bacterium]|nr:methylenetetrahydrofolate reductase [Candidatus Wallbacteria bacterium]
MNESRLEQKLRNREFPITAELFSIRGTDVSTIMKKAELLRDYADAFNITDNHRATMRVCPLAVCSKLVQTGLEPVFQITCRDRNRLALQSDTLGAYLMGIRNIFAVTGDHLSVGDYPMAFPVFDLDSVQFLRNLTELERGRDSAGKKLRGAPKFFKGAAVNMTATPEWIHLAKLRKKIVAGAQFFQSQLIFSPELALSMLEKVKGQAYFIAGITILKDLTFTRFLKEKVPGIYIPDEMIRHQEKAGDELKAGLEIAVSVIRELRDHFDGLHVMALGLEEYIPEILKKSGVR